MEISAVPLGLEALECSWEQKGLGLMAWTDRHSFGPQTQKQSNRGWVRTRLSLNVEAGASDWRVRNANVLSRLCTIQAVQWNQLWEVDEKRRF